MCYSAKLKQDFRELQRRYMGKLEWDEFLQMVRQRERGIEHDFEMKIPDELVAGLIDMGGTAAREIELHQRRWKVAEQRRLEAAIEFARKELLDAEERFKVKATKTAQNAVATKGRKVERAQRALESSVAAAGGEYRIYPYYFAPVIVSDGSKRLVVPARYRILPRTGVEVPNQYNVFNARRDSLQVVRSWKPLFGRQHALFPFERFYEWVARDSGKVEISFNPDGHDGMHAAALFEIYCHPELGPIRSFAMVTDEPPPEVSSAGHDRCPVFLQSDLIDDWLSPAGKSLEQLDGFLDHKEPTFYSHALAA